MSIILLKFICVCAYLTNTARYIIDISKRKNCVQVFEKNDQSQSIFFKTEQGWSGKIVYFREFDSKVHSNHQNAINSAVKKGRFWMFGNKHFYPIMQNAVKYGNIGILCCKKGVFWMFYPWKRLFSLIEKNYRTMRKKGGLKKVLRVVRSKLRFCGHKIGHRGHRTDILYF